MFRSWCRHLTKRQPTAARRRDRSRARGGPWLEVLETRDLPSVLAPTLIRRVLPGFGQPFGSPGPQGYTPAQIRHAYGFDQLTLPGDGSGTTIAIVDAFDDPRFVNSSDPTFNNSDLHNFDAAFGLPDPVFTKINLGGPGNVDPGWSVEIALDVEWAHAIAPKANIVLVEAADNSFNGLLAAVDTAASQSGVVAVSMSWGGGEFGGENAYDGHFTTPAGHAGVTFVASSGDSGAPPSWPAISPNVLAVGGTTLPPDQSGNPDLTQESGWSGSGGGISALVSQPAYQLGVVTQDPNFRTNPDVAYDADPNTGFPVYETVNNDPSAPWSQIGGTSDAAPQWAALIAIADQGRAAAGKAPLDGVKDTLPTLYKLPAADFHDITTGSSFGFPSYNAGPGYDLVTGLGTPVVNKLIPDLVGNVSVPTNATSFGVTAPSASTAGAAFSITVTALDSSNHPVTNYTGRVHFSSSDPAAGLPADYTFTTADQGQHTFPGVVLKTGGNQTVKAGDTFYASLTGTATVTVNAAVASRFLVGGFPSPATAGAPGTFTVTATDAYGNPNPAYTGTVSFTSSDRQAVLPTPASLTRGTGTFSATLKTAGTQSLTAADTVNTSFSGTQSGITVNPAAATHLVFGQQPSTTAVGAAISPAVTVNLLDAYNNLVTTDNTDAVTLALGGTGGGTLSGINPVTVSGGVATFASLAVSQTGTYTLTARSGNLTTATSNSFNVTPASTSAVIEDFESFSALGRYTVVGGLLGGGSPGLLTYAAAHDGTFGLMANSDVWSYRNDAAATVKRGDTISAWVQFANYTDGRAYFGFGASAKGTLSVVLAANTGQLIIQQNPGFGFQNLASVSQRYRASHWYHVVVSWGITGTITAKLYDSDGKTLLNTVTATTTLFTSGGIAFRATGSNKYFDTVTLTHGGAGHVEALSGAEVAAEPVVVPSESLVVVDVTPAPAVVPLVVVSPPAVDLSALALALGGAQFAPAAATPAGPITAASILPVAAPAAPAAQPLAAPLARLASDDLSGGGDASVPGDDQGTDVLEPWLLEWLFTPSTPAPGTTRPAAAPAPRAPAPGAVPQPKGVPGDARQDASEGGAVSALPGAVTTSAAADEDAASPTEQRAAAAGWVLVFAGLWSQGAGREADTRQRPER
jgi:hypothetical protein